MTVDLASGVTRSLARARVGWEALQPTPDGWSVPAMRPSPTTTARLRRRIDLASGRQTPLAAARDEAGTFSPDGTRVVASTGAAEAGAMVLRTIAGRPLVRLRPRVPDLAMGATWSRDGRLLAVSDQQDETRSRFRVRLVDARSGRVLCGRIVAGGEPVLLPESTVVGSS